MPNHRLLQLSKGFFALCFLFYSGYSIQLALKNVLYFDDAYMYLRYANNLLSDGTYGWNTDQNTFGCISIPYTLYVTLLKLLGAESLGQAAMLIFASASWGVVAVWSALRLGISFFQKEQEIGRAMVFMMVGLIFINPLFIKNTTTGMETSMSLCTNIWVIWAAVRAEKRGFDVKSLIFLAVFGYLTFLVRPDNGIYSVLFPVLFLWANSAGLRKTAQFGICLFALLAVDTAIKWHIFANPLPLPFYHKSNMFPGYLLLEKYEPFQNIFQFLTLLGWPFWVVFFVLGRRERDVATSFFLPLFLTFCYYFTITQVLGEDARYYFPSFAFVLVPAFYLLGKHASPIFSFNRLMIGVGLTGLLMASNFYLATIYRFRKQQSERNLTKGELYQAYLENLKIDLGQSVGSTQKLYEILQKLPKGTVIAAGEHGELAARNPHIHIIDLFGLHNPDIAIHGGWRDSILEKEKPVIVWLTYFPNTGLNKMIQSGHFFKKDYVLYRDCAKFGVAVRSDSPYFSMICREFESVGCNSHY